MSGLRGSWNFPPGHEPKAEQEEPILMPIIVGIGAIFIGAMSIHIGLAMMLTGLIPLYIGMTRYWDIKEQHALAEIKEMVEDLGLEEEVSKDGGSKLPTLSNNGGGEDGDSNDSVPTESNGKGKDV